VRPSALLPRRRFVGVGGLGGGSVSSRKARCNCMAAPLMRRRLRGSAKESVDERAGGANHQACRLRQAGAKALERSALQDARLWFEQALNVLKALPESRSNLEQGFELRLEMFRLLININEVRQGLQRLREAEALALRLNNDGRRGLACAYLTTTHALLGELDEGLETCERAL
jgi:hypothetical protein